MQRQSNGEIADATWRLLLTSGLGRVLWGRLREAFGSDEAIVQAPTRDLTRVRGVGETLARTIHDGVRAANIDEERDAMARLDTRMMLASDADYPALLAMTPDPPCGLWVRGELSDLNALSIAIVGTRRCSAYGHEQARRFARRLGEFDFTIVAGGARGVDTAAHNAAASHDHRTIAVLGSGLATPYPKDNARLFDRIVSKGGAVMSEHPMTTPPLPRHFPRRNRVIAGLSLGVLVIEAPLRSGALITARVASDLGREVMCVPGRVDTLMSAGSHRAIHDGWATLVTNHKEVLEQLESSRVLVEGAMDAFQAGRCRHGGATDGELRSEHGDDGVGFSAGGGREGGSGSGPRVGAAGAMPLAALATTPRQRAILEVLSTAGGEASLDELVVRLEVGVSDILADVTLLELRSIVRRSRDGVRLHRPLSGGGRG